MSLVLARRMAQNRIDAAISQPKYHIIIWDEEGRRHSRARLDALFFMLYGLDRDAVSYILNTFPIVREQETAVYNGRYRSKDLILGYMSAFAAGDSDTRIAA